jgi:SNF2 family DNA or RNA helicase
MGVGKTVQILTFLAWCIESGKFPGLSESEPPFQPILIVAPLILVDTRTWEKEMEKFFANEGVIFWPVLSLRGDQLAKLRLDDVAGREIEIGTPILDLNRIQRHKVVITNYETKKTVGRISFIARNALTQFDRPSLLAGGSMCEKPGGDELVRG